MSPPAKLNFDVAARKFYWDITLSLQNQDLQKIQALMMIQMKLHKNMTYKEIAKEMNVHPETVERRFIFAEKAGLFLDLEKEIITKIVPKAMKAIETALEDGDSETALEILRSVGVLRDPKAQKTTAQVQEDDQLIRAIGEAREQRALEENTVEGNVIGRTSLAGLLEGQVEAAKEGSVTGSDPEQSTTSEITPETSAGNL